MKIRSLVQAVAIAVASLSMAGAASAPACAQDDEYAELRECFRGCNAAYGPYGLYPNSTFLRQCQQRCCEQHGGC